MAPSGGGRKARRQRWQPRDGGATTWIPALDVIEDQQGYVVTAELPGIDPAAVEISFERNVLVLRGTKPATIETPENGQIRVFEAERRSGAFERMVRLPEHVNAEAIEAAYANGVLTVTIPKAERALPRKIAITTAG